MIKIRIKKTDEMPDQYAQGEHHIDLTKGYADVAPLFAAHLVKLGYAEYLAKDLKETDAKANDAPNFVAREDESPIIRSVPTAGEVAPVPTEELILAPESSPATISEPPAVPEPETEQGTKKPKKEGRK